MRPVRCTPSRHLKSALSPGAGFPGGAAVPLPRAAQGPCLQVAHILLAARAFAMLPSPPLPLHPTRASKDNRKSLAQGARVREGGCTPHSLSNDSGRREGGPDTQILLTASQAGVMVAQVPSGGVRVPISTWAINVTQALGPPCPCRSLTEGGGRGRGRPSSTCVHMY